MNFGIFEDFGFCMVVIINILLFDFSCIVLRYVGL